MPIGTILFPLNFLVTCLRTTTKKRNNFHGLRIILYGDKELTVTDKYVTQENQLQRF